MPQRVARTRAAAAFFVCVAQCRSGRLADAANTLRQGVRRTDGALPALGLVFAAPVLAGRVSLVRSARPAWWAGAVVALGAIAFALVMNIATA